MTGQKTLLERPADQLKLGLLLDRAKTKPRDGQIILANVLVA